MLIQDNNYKAHGLFDNHEVVELVKNFKKLSENYLHYNQIGFLKAKKAEELAKVIVKYYQKLYSELEIR